MASSIVLLWALALLSVTVEASSSGGILGRIKRSAQRDLSGSALTRLFNSPVHQAERVERPLSGFPFMAGDLSHSGVRVRLEDDTTWLIHKDKNSGTVVTDDAHMSSKWRPVPSESRDFQGSRTVSDFVGVGGANYHVLKDNCHKASRGMMNQ